MIAFDVPDMTCGHCASTITKAVQAADRSAQVQIDLPQHRVTVTAGRADAAALQAAIAEAGYSPVPAAAAPGA